jgi:hypothetical protein
MRRQGCCDQSGASGARGILIMIRIPLRARSAATKRGKPSDGPARLPIMIRTGRLPHSADGCHLNATCGKSAIFAALCWPSGLLSSSASSQALRCAEWSSS